MKTQTPNKSVSWKLSPVKLLKMAIAHKSEIITVVLSFALLDVTKICKVFHQNEKDTWTSYTT